MTDKEHPNYMIEKLTIPKQQTRVLRNQRELRFVYGFRSALLIHINKHREKHNMPEHIFCS